VNLARIMVPLWALSNLSSLSQASEAIYTIPSTTAMTEIPIKILIELLSSISLAIKQAKLGRLSEYYPQAPILYLLTQRTM
jgi:hypothetical protein